MPKKSTKRSNKKKLSRRGIWFYVKTLFIPVIIGIFVFNGTSFFLKSQPVCANSKTCKELSLKIDNNAVGIFQGRKVIPPKIDLALDIYEPKSTVLGAKTEKGDKHIYINLETQTLYAYQGNTQVLKTLISSGKWGKTPSGNFNIWTKLRATRMSGGSGADAYDLPNVPYVMYYYNDFGLHGAYWHNNFGHPMSHGCINMRIVDAKAIFEWADGPEKGQKGTPVSVCNKFVAPNKCVQENPVK